MLTLKKFSYIKLKQNTTAMHKKRAFIISILYFSSFCLSAAGIHVDKKTALQIDREIEKHIYEIIRTRRYIHINPELGNHEYETAKLVASKLMSLAPEMAKR